MTSAHRNTFNSAKGQLDPGGVRTMPSKLISAKQQPGYLSLKRRNFNNDYSKYTKNKFKEELLLRENEYYKNKQNENSIEVNNVDNKMLMIDCDSTKSHFIKNKLHNKQLQIKDDAINNNIQKKLISNINVDNKQNNLELSNSDNNIELFKHKNEYYKKTNEYKAAELTLNEEIFNNHTKDKILSKEENVDNEEKDKEDIKEQEQEEQEQEEQEQEEQEQEEQDYDYDDEILSNDSELLREYEKIKKEKEELKRKQYLNDAESVKNRNYEEILSGNPLFANEYSLSKKWYDDTVFKNQASKEIKTEKRFINNTVRSDYHKKFMYKTIH